MRGMITLKHRATVCKETSEEKSGATQRFEREKEARERSQNDLKWVSYHCWNLEFCQPSTVTLQITKNLLKLLQIDHLEHELDQCENILLS